jgi:hypothetical protein
MRYAYCPYYGSEAGGYGFGLATKRWRPGMTEPGQWTAPRI